VFFVTLLAFLFAVGLFSGTVDAIAGGGGLISLPILLSIGMPPHIAFGTSKLQAIVGTFAAAKRYYKAGWISFANLYQGLIFGFIGSALGAVAAQALSGHVLQKIIPVLLTLVLVYTLVSPKLGTDDQEPRMSPVLFYVLFGFGMGFYDGFFGPGVGSMWIFVLTFLLGYNIVKATAYTKILNLNSSTVATICFIIGGNVNYKFAACMALGQLIGGRLGAGLAIKNGTQLVRPIFLTVVTATISVLVYRAYSQHDGSLPQMALAAFVVASLLLFYRRRQLSS
jgi:uncharacterized membrane protein YfcA